MDGVVRSLVVSTGLVVSAKEEKVLQSDGIDLDSIKTSLNMVMGPVGAMIFEDVYNRWRDQDNPRELINLIKTEIKDHKKIDLFMENI
jgi:hypothetical protein